MKKVITIFLVNLAITMALFFTACSNNAEPTIGDAIRLDAVEKARLSDSITTTNKITFKCSLNYQIGSDEETGDFIFCLKDEQVTYKTIVISCDKVVTEADYYSNENALIYKNKKPDKEWIKIDPDYCNTDCSYAIIYVEDNEKLFYAKFIRK